MHTFIDNIITFSLRNKFFIFFCTTIAVIAGITSFIHTPIDAFPDVTNTKVTIITQWPGRSAEEIEKMSWLGISGIANVLCCIKMAKYYELTENDVVATVLTDSAVMYGSRIEELNQQHGAYNAHEAALDHAVHMLGLKTDSMLELTYTERKRVHLGGAAGYGRGGPERPVVRHQEHLGCRSRSGQGAGSADLRVQRGHRPAEGSVSTGCPTRRRRGGTSVPPLRVIPFGIE